MSPMRPRLSFPSRGPLLFCCAVLSLIFSASIARAQDTVTGAFEGIVSDSQTGVALKGARVEIINQQTGLTFSLQTDYRGGFFQGLLLPGIYVVRVSMPGYQTKEVFQRLRITYTGEVVPIPVALDPVLLVLRLPRRPHLSPDLQRLLRTLTSGPLLVPVMVAGAVHSQQRKL